MENTKAPAPCLCTMVYEYSHQPGDAWLVPGGGETSYQYVPYVPYKAQMAQRSCTVLKLLT